MNSISFGFAVSDNGFVSNALAFSVFDGTNLLASTTVDADHTPTVEGTSSFPEAFVQIDFIGTATHATFNFNDSSGRYIIDDFEGTFGSTEEEEIASGGSGAIPEPSTYLMLALAIIGIPFVKRKLSSS